MARHLFDRIQHGNEIKIPDHVRISGHMTGIDHDFRSAAQGLANGCTFLGLRDKEAPCSCAGQSPGHARCAKPVAIRFDGGGRFGASTGFCIKGTPVFYQRIQIDRKSTCSHGLVV